MAPKRKHWVLRRLDDLRCQAKNVAFSSGTTRRRKDLIELLSAINNSSGGSFPWFHSFHMSASDNGSTAKIILTPKHVFNKTHGKIILEFPSTHNTHRTVFIFSETQTGLDVAKILQKNLATLTMGFAFPIILKQGRKLFPLDPA